MAASITIGRQVVTVETLGTATDGLALQRRMPGVCAEVVTPALEAALGPFDPGEPTLRVDRIAVAVAVDSIDRLAEALARALPAELENLLLAHRLVQGAPPTAGGVELRSAVESADDALIAFLATGQLPWSFRVPAGSTLEQLVRQRWAASSPDGAPSRATRSRLFGVLSARQVRLRLRLQFTRRFVLSLLRWVVPEWADALDEARRPTAGADQALSGDNPLSVSEVCTARLLEAVLAADLTRPPPAPSELVRWAASGTLDRHPATPTTTFHRQDTVAPDPPDHHPASPASALRGQDAAASGLTGDSRAFPESQPEIPRPPETTARVTGPALEPGVSMIVADTMAEPAAASARWSEAPPIGLAEGTVVANAGLVLLHPFLTRFLTGLDLADDDGLLDPGRAICLLHYLATGELVAPEHEVMLAKALCGLRLDEPVPAEVRLTPAETDKADALLRAVIGHWQALRDTSPDGLRHEFLRREGVLSTDRFDDWALRVETRTSDILLDQLPWGLSMIGLPWMPRLLRVEWH